MSTAYQQLYAQLMTQLSNDIASGTLRAGKGALADSSQYPSHPPFGGTFGNGTFGHLPGYVKGAPPPPSAPPPSYNCTICKLSFAHQNALSLHLHNVHGHQRIGVFGADGHYASKGGVPTFGDMHDGKGQYGFAGGVQSGGDRKSVV